MDDVVTSLKAEAAAGVSRRPVSRRQIAAAVMGNALEFYDFTTYTLFAVQIGRTFFPVHSAFENLMLSLLTFAVGFIGRPIGAVVIGLIGDRKGRRPAMLLSFILMGAALLGLVLIPPYAKIGPLAPLLLVICRLTQGFALGGEVGPTTAFLIEAAPTGRRGLVGAWQSASQSVASLAGAAVGLLLSNLLTGPQLETFGWRIAFGIGALVLPFGLALRKGLPETLHRPEPGFSPGVERGDLTDLPQMLLDRGMSYIPLRPMLLGLGMIMSFTTSTYVLLYMTTFASETLHMSQAASFGASVANGVSGVAFTLLGGALSDRFGRKRVMITARVLFLLCVVPAFSIMVRNHDALSVMLATGIMSALSSTSVGVALVALTESLRKDVRSTGLAVIYAVGVAVFGGIAQPSITWMIKASGSPMAPAWYMMAAAGVGILAMSAMRETHPARIEGALALIETG